VMNDDLYLRLIVLAVMLWTACPSRASGPRLSCVASLPHCSPVCCLSRQWLEPLLRLRGGTDSGHNTDRPANKDAQTHERPAEACVSLEDHARASDTGPAVLVQQGDDQDFGDNFSYDADWEQKRLPAGIQRMIDEALAENTTIFPGGPPSTKSTLEEAAWEFLKQVRRKEQGKEGAGEDTDDEDGIEFLDVEGEENGQELKANLRAMRRICQHPDVTAFLDHTHLTEPPLDYLEACRPAENGGGKDGKRVSLPEEGWCGNWLGVGGHWTSLMHACRSGAADLVEAMLASNRTLATAVEPETGVTALHWAAISAAAHMPARAFRRLEQLSDKEDKTNKEWKEEEEAEESMEYGQEEEGAHVKCARALLGAMGPGQISQIANAVDHSGRSPLSYAVQSRPCCLAMVNLLMSSGADINATDVGGRTPLHWAALMGDWRAVEALLKAGADVNRVSRLGVHFACFTGTKVQILTQEALLLC
jgi:hypothetical protein